MGLNKLLKKMGDILNTETEKKKKYRKKLKNLIEDLRDKEKQLEKKLASTRDERKQNRLQKELDIVRVELSKGTEALENAE